MGRRSLYVVKCGEYSQVEDPFSGGSAASIVLVLLIIIASFGLLFYYCIYLKRRWCWKKHEQKRQQKYHAELGIENMEPKLLEDKNSTKITIVSKD